MAFIFDKSQTAVLSIVYSERDYMEKEVATIRTWLNSVL